MRFRFAVGDAVWMVDEHHERIESTAIIGIVAYPSGPIQCSVVLPISGTQVLIDQDNFYKTPMLALKALKEANEKEQEENTPS